MRREQRVVHYYLRTERLAPPDGLRDGDRNRDVTGRWRGRNPIEHDISFL